MSKRNPTKQGHKTPPELVQAIKERFGPIIFDLAAASPNVCPDYFNEKDDSLKQDWTAVYHANGGSPNVNGPAWMYLNPPFSGGPPGKGEKKERSLYDWMRKCWHESRTGSRILVLIPTSTDSEWWNDWVRGKARDEALSPRVQFVGSEQPFMKPLSLIIYEPGVFGANGGRWRWKP